MGGSAGELGHQRAAAGGRRHVRRPRQTGAAPRNPGGIHRGRRRLPGAGHHHRPAPRTVRPAHGAWLIGAGLNYAPLAAHALDLTRQGRLETELRDVDVAAEAGYYSRAQFWIMLPLAMVAADLV